MKPETKKSTALVGGREIVFETGKLAGQAGGALTIRLGDSLVFCSATMSNQPREGQDFFPLTVDYEERMYAGGRIPGSFFRREGRPSEEAILIGRLTDRPIRPLFPKGMRNEVQVILFSLSADMENSLDILAINAASAALMISDVPWEGPVGAVRVGRINGEFIVNPTMEQREQSELDLRLAGTRDAILMVECSANELPEDLMVQALTFAHQSLQPMIDAQLKMAAEIGKTKRTVESKTLDENLVSLVRAHVESQLVEALDAPYHKLEMYGRIDELRESAVTTLSVADETLKGAIAEAYEEVLKDVVRRRIVDEGKRPDGRKPNEIRPIWGEVGVSPRAHGSGLFTRGETQVLTMATLGTPKEAQELDNLGGSDTKRYIH
ncbi:polyribonucleotide nucleotidyltransferase, partial [bacterium]|nr:polyribonucleotide nucleotidyltransferase [bacterium]